MLNNCYIVSIILLTLTLFAVLFLLNYLFRIIDDEKEISPQEYTELILLCKRTGGGKVLKRFYSENKSVINKKNYRRIKRIVRSNYFSKLNSDDKKISKFELSKIISTM